MLESIFDEEVQFVLDVFECGRKNFTVAQGVLNFRNNFTNLAGAAVTNGFSLLGEQGSIELRRFLTLFQQFLNFHRNLLWLLLLYTHGPKSKQPKLQVDLFTVDEDFFERFYFDRRSWRHSLFRFWDNAVFAERLNHFISDVARTKPIA